MAQTDGGSHGLAKPRTLLQWLADSLVARLWRLQPPTGTYTVARDVRIPARDGIELLADLYTPVGPLIGTLLVRSPYGWKALMATLMGGVYASRGYRVILARCRGTFGSGGHFEPMMHEIDDGADTVAWMRAQPWFDGRFATLGGSYLGFTQWALLMDPPPELVCAVITVGPHDFRAAAYQGGAFNLLDFLGWSAQVGQQEAPFARILWNLFTSRGRVANATRALPLADAGEALLEGRSPWYREWVSRRNPDDPFWTPMKLDQALARVNVPVLVQSGWQDLFLQQSLEQYGVLAARGVDVALTVGPWTHTGAAITGGRIVVRDTLDWLGEHLGGSGIRTRMAAARVFVTGAAEQWRDLPAWPPRTQDVMLYPAAGGGLGDRPSAQPSQATFTYDPADPTPTIGGRVLMHGGYVDDSALAARRDVLVFTGAVLRAPCEVHGKPVVELAHVTDNPHADLFVRLSEVDPAGRSRNVSDSFLRLDPAAANGTTRLELDAIAHRFAAGNRIRLLIAGGCHPRWERNLGTGADPATSDRMAASRRTIDLGASCLILPVSFESLNAPSSGSSIPARA